MSAKRRPIGASLRQGPSAKVARRHNSALAQRLAMAKAENARLQLEQRNATELLRSHNLGEMLQARQALAERARQLEQLNGELELALERHRQAQATIEQLNANLERRVAERTTQLSAALANQQNVEAALRASEERYRLIAEHSEDLIVLLDGQARYIYVSPSVYPLLGYEPAALLGEFAFDSIHPDDVAHVLERWTQVGERNDANAMFRYQHANGSWRWFDARGSLLARGKETYALIVGRDITLQRRLEQQLMLVQKLDGIGRLAGGVAHDFNNLLVVISGSAQLAAGVLPADSPAHEDLAEIQSAVARAASLTRQLLAFARRQPSDLKLINFNQLLQELWSQSRWLLREGIEPDLRLAPDLWPVRADAAQLEQVLVNLLVNACDAMPNGGKLTVETTNALLDGPLAPSSSALVPGEYLLITVSDTGLGMSEEVQRHALEPFFTTKEPGRGTGLGLASCYGIVGQHGGSILLSSELKQGTVVKIYLPRASESLEFKSPPALARPRSTA